MKLWAASASASDSRMFRVNPKGTYISSESAVNRDAFAVSKSAWVAYRLTALLTLPGDVAALHCFCALLPIF